MKATLIKISAEIKKKHIHNSCHVVILHCKANDACCDEILSSIIPWLLLIFIFVTELVRTCEST